MIKVNNKPLGLALVSFTLLSLLFSGLIYLSYNNYQNRQKQSAERKLKRITQQLTSNLESKIQIVNLLAGYASYNGKIDSVEFVNIARHVFKENKDNIKCLQWAPDAVISNIYPLEGNEAALGLHLLEYKTTKTDTRNSLDSRKGHLNGPIPLVQGGLGLVYRVPVFSVQNTRKNAESPFLGFAAIVLNLDDFLRESGLSDIEQKNIGIKFIHDVKEKQFFKDDVFFGDSQIFKEDHATETLSLFSEKWELGVKIDYSLLPTPIWFFMFFGAIALSALIAYLLYRNSTQLRLILQKNKQLSIKNIQIEKQVKEKSLLMDEIHHRVKNNFQLVSSLARLQSYELEDPKSIEALQEFSNRVSALALSHEQLIYSDGEKNQVNMRSYITTLIDNLTSRNELKNIKLDLSVSNKQLPLKEMILLGIIINELITNSLKYAFQKTDHGLIRITLHKNESVELSYLDNGIGFNSGILEKEQESFGIELIKNISEQLDGKLSVQQANGLQGFKLVF